MCPNFVFSLYKHLPGVYKMKYFSDKNEPPFYLLDTCTLHAILIICNGFKCVVTI